MSAEYQYETSGSVNIEQLKESIVASSVIVKTVKGIGYDGTNLRVSFDAVLSTDSPDELTELNDIVAAHVPVNHELKLHRYIATNGTDHRQVNYKTGLTSRLEKKITDMFRGEVRSVEYHADNNFNDLVLKVVIAYNRATNGLAVDRTTTRTWYREDGTPHPDAKVTFKTYDHDNLAQMREGRRRRENVIDQLKLVVLQLMAMTETAGDIAAAEAIAIPWIAAYEDHIGNYVGTGDLTWRTSGTPNITDDTATWLDNLVDGLGLGYTVGWTIRDVILDSLQEIMA